MANVDPNSSAACIAALRSRASKLVTQACCGWFETVQETKHGLLKIEISTLDIPFIKTIYIICHCIFLDPVT